MHTPLFSVLIANYNNGKYIAQSIESVIKQTYKNWEIIIVDDASSDDSKYIVTGFLNDKRIKFFENEKNKGCGFTKRRCADLASGEICGFLDPDDLLTSNALKTMVEEHMNNLDASLIYSNFFSCNDKLERQMEIKNRQLPSNITYLELAQPCIGHFASFKLINYKQSSGIDFTLQRAVDQDLYYKLEEHGRVIYIDIPLYYYRMHANGISVFNNFHKAFSWHLYVVIETCKRRGIPFENIISKMIKHSYIDFYEKSKAFRIGTFLLWPFKKVKNSWSNYISIRE